VQAAFEVLRQRFLAGLPARWTEISEATDAQLRAAALHRLVGAAGGFGLPELGLAALEAERGGEPLGGRSWAALEQQLALLGVTVR
jgi:hypothetical protein